MKRTFLLFVALAICLWGYGQNSITSITPNSAIQGQQVTVTIMGQNTMFSSATGAVLISNNTFSWIMNTSYTVVSDTEMTAQFNLLPNADTGLYRVTVDPYYGVNLFTVTPAGPNLTTITGQVYRDADNNCSYGGPDNPVQGQVVEFYPGPFVAYTDANGDYSTTIPSGNYTAVVSPGLGWVVTCPVSQSHSVNASTPGSTVSGIDFGYDSTPVQDIRVFYNSWLIRPGIPSWANIYVFNDGNIPFSGDVTYIKDPRVSIYGTPLPAPYYSSNDTMVWNLSLGAGGVGHIGLGLVGDITLQAGDTTYYTLYCDTPAIDVNPANNRINQDIVTVASYDPNDKAVFLQNGANADGIIGLNDTTLIYRVRFQNTGTDTAFNIIVRDTLSPHLDRGSFRFLASSHPAQVSMDPYGRLAFTFANILLPDSNVNEQASHGYLIYEIDRLSGLSEGTEVLNSASIYFDFNAPVLTNTVSSKVCSPLSIGFGHQVNSFNTIAFNNTSTGNIQSISWDFGDGSNSGATSPSHQYAAPGVYNVCLTITDACRTETWCDWVQVCQPPAAAYQSSANLLTVTFQDMSSASVNAWSWDFGDGNSSSQQNPSHTYAAQGTYVVCLTASDSCTPVTYCDTLNLVCPPPVAGFGWLANQLQVAFGNQSTGQSNATYAWDFGDGASSTALSPIHQYTAPGAYPVCLTITDPCGSTSYCDTVQVSCVAPAAAMNHVVNGLQVQFSDVSQGQVTGRLWDFGDGLTSTAPAPLHNYAGPGSYTACLMVENECGARDTTCVTLPLVVGVEAPGPFRTVALYPNPNSGLFDLELELDGPGQLQVRVFDLRGKLFASMDQGTVQGSFRRRIDLSDVPAGSYLLQIDLDGRAVNRIFTIQR